jgi:hypothetical protein
MHLPSSTARTARARLRLAKERPNCLLGFRALTGQQLLHIQTSDLNQILGGTDDATCNLALQSLGLKSFDYIKEAFPCLIKNGRVSPVESMVSTSPPQER